ncbi:DNA polymerase Y family protein [Rhodoferax sp. OV413]|uniref:Y-family DNA polymerase n=1 Tax=Rhodoferax sp. OV413 TaxID=1855285 RepID=UPI0025E76575|nr:DNA polymerase Y family protein [Rhodoferax sp. OV413]
MHWIALRPLPDAAPHPPAPALVDASTALAWWSLRFTPLVARVGEALVLELSASERLFGGRAALLQHFLGPNRPLAQVEYAQGATSLIALAALQVHPWRLAPAPPGRVVVPDALPVHALAAARAHLPTLARLGVRTWGQLRALPRGGLVRRFGAELLDALDRAYGQRPEVYPWLTLPDVFDAPLELAASVDSAPALLFGARRLLAQLLVWLRARQAGVLALELLWELDARRANTRHIDAHHHGGQQGTLTLRTAEATQDMTHLQRILGEQLARVTLPAPVLYLRMRTLQTQPLGGESHSLLPEDVRKGDSLHHTLERLTARLGPDSVQCATPQADHRPERMQRWQPWRADTARKESLSAMKSGADRAISVSARGLKGPESEGAVLPAADLYPTWLLPVPQRLVVREPAPQSSLHHTTAQHRVPCYHGELTLLAGPQRLETGWLDGEPALRDYFVARSPQAGLVWVYRERLAAHPASAPRPADPDGLSWFLHGVFA